MLGLKVEKPLLALYLKVALLANLSKGLLNFHPILKAIKTIHPAPIITLLINVPERLSGTPEWALDGVHDYTGNQGTVSLFVRSIYTHNIRAK